MISVCVFVILRKHGTSREPLVSTKKNHQNAQQPRENGSLEGRGRSNDSACVRVVRLCASKAGSMHCGTHHGIRWNHLEPSVDLRTT